MYIYIYICMCGRCVCMYGMCGMYECMYVWYVCYLYVCMVCMVWYVCMVQVCMCVMYAYVRSCVLAVARCLLGLLGIGVMCGGLAVSRYAGV